MHVSLLISNSYGKLTRCVNIKGNSKLINEKKMVESKIIENLEIITITSKLSKK